MKDEGSKSSRLQERDGEEELFVRVRFEVVGGGGVGGGEERFERVGRGFVEAEDFSGVEEWSERGLNRGEGRRLVRGEGRKEKRKSELTKPSSALELEPEEEAKVLGAGPA